MKMSSKLLLVEDDPILGEGLVLSLQLEGLTVDWAKTLRDGREKYNQSSFDLVILDIGLPDGLGLELCREIRTENQAIPVVFLTARTDEETVVMGLEDGANDFVKKPFSNKELMARVKGLLRGKVAAAKDLKAGELILNQDKREASYKGKLLGLNRRQFDILSYFMGKQGQIITREQLLNHLDNDGSIFDRTIDSHLSQLRRTLKKSGVGAVQILSVYGVGYRLEVLE